MYIEKCRLKVTLQSAKNVWEEGTIFTDPIPPDILEEIMLERGTVEVLEYGKASKSTVSSGTVVSMAGRKLRRKVV